MTTTTDTTAPAVEVDEQADAYANTLRLLAGHIADGAIVCPRIPLRLYLTSYFGDTGASKAAFLAARQAFPDATVEMSDDYVELHVGEQALLLFDKHSLGTQTTVTREVVEYVIEPELLASQALCRQCGRVLHDEDPSNTGLGYHVDCTSDGALAGQPS